LIYKIRREFTSILIIELIYLHIVGVAIKS